MAHADHVAIIGGGICGLALALNLQKRGISCRVYERTPEIRELGVGITLLPHAMREFNAVGLGDRILAAGIENRESRFYNRFGQLIYKEPRGKFAGYPLPEAGIHRGKLHTILYQAVIERLGPDAVRIGHGCTGVEQTDSGVILRFKDRDPVQASIAVACDGVNSTIRKQFYPGDKVVFTGINTWRGTTRHKPILTGREYLRIGSILTGKIVIYPIADDIDGNGSQLINWTAEIKQEKVAANDWNMSGKIADVLPIYKDWVFDWLDVAALIRDSEQVLEYPMVDKDPIERWTFGRVTLAGDAAHPMYPRGSNGAAQSTIDARVLADFLQGHDGPAALAAYETARSAAAAKVVRTNREHPPDFINIRVEELVGDRPFGNLDDYISQDELRTLSENYKRIAGFSLTDVSQPAR